MPTFHFTTYIYRGPTEREFPVEVSYTATTGTPARLYGDYPHPAEPGEIDILKAVVVGDSYPLTEDEWQALQEECEGRADSDLAEYAAEAAEYRAELAAEGRWAA